MSISTVNQSRLWVLEITDSLFILLLQAATGISLSIDFTNIMHSIQHKDNNKPLGLRNRGLPQLKALRLWEGHCLHSLPHPCCSLSPDTEFAEFLSPGYYGCCLPMISWWLQWLACELQWLGEGRIKQLVGSAVGKVIMGREVWSQTGDCCPYHHS